jgi:hypothetical protein
LRPNSAIVVVRPAQQIPEDKRIVFAIELDHVRPPSGNVE